MLKKSFSNFSILTICILILLFKSTYAQWQQTNGPFGCNVNCLVQHDSVALSGTLQGLYYSADSGITWNQYPLFQNKNIQSIYSKGDTLILLYSSGYVENNYFDSTYSISSFDNGVNWTSPLFFGTTGTSNTILHNIPGKVNSVLHDALGKVIAVDFFVGPYISYDYGLSWIPVSLPTGIFTDFTFSGNYVFLTVMDNTFTYSYYYLSRIDSINFILVDTNNYIIDKASVDSVIFGNHVSSPGNYEIVKSIDSGQTWTTIAVTDSFQNFYLGAVDSIFYFRTNSGFYKYTTDYGINWDSFPPNPTPFFIMYKYPVDIGNNNLLVTSGYGFSIYNAVTNSTIDLPNYIKGAYIQSISSNDSSIYCLGDYLFGSRDDGTTWDTLNNSIFYYAPQLIFGDTLFTTYFDVYRSFDGGHNWTTITMPTMVFYMTRKGNRIYASSGWATYFSDDFGDHWIQCVNPPQQVPCGSGFNSSAGGSLCEYANHLFFVDDSEGSVFRLDSIDASWICCLCLPYVQFQTYDEPLMFSLNNAVVISSEVGMFYSLDTGNSWYATGQGLPHDFAGNRVYPKSLVSYGNCWIGAFGKWGVLASYNNGNTWSPLGGSPSPFIATGVTISHNQLFVSTEGRGVWTTNYPVSIQETKRFSTELKIYPNPAIDFIYLDNFDSPQLKNVVFIYDSGGRLISKLEPGLDHSINIKLLSQGIYFGRIITDKGITNVFRFVKEN